MPDDLQWETLEHLYKKKGADWYLSVIIIAISLAVASFFFDDIIFAILLLIATFALLLNTSKIPKKVTVKISGEGVRFGEYFYPYSTLDSFNIIQKEDQKEPTLLIKSQKLIMPLITVQIKDVDADDVSEYLSEYIKRDEELFEPFFQNVVEYIGF